VRRCRAVGGFRGGTSISSSSNHGGRQGAGAVGPRPPAWQGAPRCASGTDRLHTISRRAGCHCRPARREVTKEGLQGDLSRDRWLTFTPFSPAIRFKSASSFWRALRA
jgi:hypothetical protein